MVTTDIIQQAFKIRRAKKIKETEIIEFIKENWKSVKFDDNFIKDNLPISLDVFWKDPRSYFLLMELKGVIKAAISFCTLFNDKDTDICFLKNFYVHNEIRGMGIGKLILNACMIKAEEMNYRLVYLETKKTFKRAIHLYKKYGFEEVSYALVQTEYPADIFMIANIEDVIYRLATNKQTYM